MRIEADWARRSTKNITAALQSQQSVTELWQLLSAGPDVPVGLFPTIVEKSTWLNISSLRL